MRALSANPTQAAVAGAIWEAIVNKYRQGGRTRVELPARQVADALIAVLANVISQIPENADRAKIVSEVAPKVCRMVTAVRSRPDVFLPSRPRLVI